MIAKYSPSKTPLFVFFSIILCMPIIASAHGNEDVNFTGVGLSAGFATAILLEKIPIGQTFIPNANDLVGLDLKIQTGQSTGSRMVTVEIREGGILGTVVGQSTDTFNVPGTGPFIHHFDFDPPVPLTPGLTYAIQVPFVDISLAGSSSVNPMDPLLYPDGAFFQGGFGGPEPGGATFIPQLDLVFTTYSSPEPDPLLDSDGDKLLDIWEIQGIDINDDGIVDLDLPALGADPFHKDIFIEVDYMPFHKPNTDAINDLVAAFAIAPVANPDGLDGINLHVTVDQNLVFHNDCILMWSGFDAIKASNFGTFAEIIDANNVNILAAKKLVFYYSLFVHKQCFSGNAGTAERPGNDLVISLGDNDAGHNPAINGRTQHSGLFMHEFGHNLGLRHGGGDDINCKPNYLSVMKYNRTFPSYIPDRPLDYSREKIDDLVENDLNETQGVAGTLGLTTMYGPHIFPTVLFQISATGIPIDWNRDGDADDTAVQSDINRFVGLSQCSTDNPQETLRGYDDWSNLQYLGTGGNFADFTHIPLDPFESPEITVEDIKAMQLQHLQALDAVIQELADAAFSKPNNAGNRKKALQNKLNAVAALLEANDFVEAIEKLTDDIRAKMDGSVGGKSRNDWIVDPAAQAQLITILDNFVATLEKALE